MTKTLSEYARALRGALPASVFAPARKRLLWLALHLGVAAAGITIIALGWGGWPVALALAFVVGHGFAGSAFVAHETLHGAVVRGRRWRLVLGWLAFLPFMLSPTLWIAWHNKVHHGHTAQVGVDPDAYPSLAVYRSSAAIRFVDHISFGARRVAGVLTLLLGFTGQSLAILLGRRDAVGITRGQRGSAIAHTLAGAAVWTGVAFLVGGFAFLFAFVVPLLIANTIVMSYILTNHCLSPHTDVNDPLLNSLSVTTPRVLDVLHLNFGFHVEHHLFPAMSGRHARKVRDAIRARWPERYQSMSLARAIWRLFTTPRIYKNATTLVDPKTGRETPTLAPRAQAATQATDAKREVRAWVTATS